MANPIYILRKELWRFKDQRITFGWDVSKLEDTIEWFEKGGVVVHEGIVRVSCTYNNAFRTPSNIFLNVKHTVFRGFNGERVRMPGMSGQRRKRGHRGFSLINDFPLSEIVFDLGSDEGENIKNSGGFQQAVSRYCGGFDHPSQQRLLPSFIGPTRGQILSRRKVE